MRMREKSTFFTKCLCLYFMLMVCNIFSIAGMGTILKFYAIFLLVISIANFRDVTIVFDSTFISQIMYLFICTCSLLYSINFQSSLSSFSMVLTNFGLVILCQSIKFSEFEVNALKKSMIWSGIIVLFTSLFFSSFSAEGRLTIEIFGYSADHNELNGYILFAFAYFVYQLINSSKKKIFNLTIVFAFLLFTFATGSRGAMVSILSIVVILLLIKVRNNKKDILKVLLFVIIFLIAFSVIFSILPEDVARRFSLDYIEEHGSTSRTDIWEALLTRFFNDDLLSQLFGKGIGTTVAYNTYGDYVAHNLFIEILIGTGFVGLLFYIILLISMLKKAWKSENYIVFAVLCGFIIISMTLSTTTYKPIFNIFMITEISFRTFSRNTTNALASLEEK